MRHSPFLLFALLLILAQPAHGEDEFHCLGGIPTPPPRKAGQPWRACVNPANALFHGSVWRWHENEMLASKEFYVNGSAEGEFRTWYENGNPQARGVYNDGDKVGIWKYWSPSGKLDLEVKYGAGVNLYTSYYPTGEMKAIGDVRKGQKVGKWSYRERNGQELARCDFGDGLFQVSTDDCRKIADELPPKGFSRPLPRTKVEPDGSGRINIGGQIFSFRWPADWFLDLGAASKDNISAAFYPSSGTWRGKNPCMYIRAIFKKGRPFADVVEAEAKDFQQDVHGYREKASKAKYKCPLPFVARNISYRPLGDAEPGFKLVSTHVFHETVVYVDASDEVVLLVVLTGENAKELKEANPALRSLLETLNASS